MERKRRSLSHALLIVALLLLTLSIQTCGPLSLNHEAHANVGVLSLKQGGAASSLELGYGPTSLAPTSEKIPIYTIGDQLWIESNYASPVYIMLQTPSTTLAQTSIQPNAIEPIYAFVSDLPTSNLTLDIPAYQLTIPIQFVNPTSVLVSSTPHYSISNSTLVASFADANQSDKFDIQQCLSNSSSATEAMVPIPASFGSGFIGITGDPSFKSAQLLLKSANPAGPFSFSFELLTNYTFTLPVGGSGVGYVSSPLEVARSDAVVLGLPQSTITSNFGSAINASSFVMNTTLSSLASLRSGRYMLVATFANGNDIQEVETPLLITSPNASAWFWLGSCVQLSDVSSLFSTRASLASSPSQWPRYLYLMYQIQPGVDAFTNVSLGLSLNAVKFTSNGNATGLPSDIKLSWLSNHTAIVNSSIESYGNAYFITNGNYPITTTFELSFAGRTFMTTSVILQSPYKESIENIQLPQLTISVSQNGNAVNNATVTIHSNNLNTSYVTHTSRDGRVVVFVPSGQYTITAESGKYMSTAVEESFLGGSSYAVPINFPGPPDYTSYLIWILSIIAVIGAIGNLWFYLARRRIRQYLR